MVGQKKGETEAYFSIRDIDEYITKYREPLSPSKDVEDHFLPDMK